MAWEIVLPGNSSSASTDAFSVFENSEAPSAEIPLADPVDSIRRFLIS